MMSFCITLVRQGGGRSICSDRQHSHVRTVSKRRCPSRLRHSQGINRINSLRRSNAENLFPLETFVAVDLLPCQLSNFAERIQYSMAFGLLQGKQVFLERLIVKVQDDPCI